MKQKKSIIITVINLLLMMILSCNKMLDIHPRQSIDSSTALSSKEGIEASIIGAYNRLQSISLYGRDMIAMAESLADNAIHTGNSSHLSNAAINTRGSHLDLWRDAYYTINDLNLIIKALEISSFDEEWKASIYGQAYFLRALLYHDLVRTYAYDPTASIDERNYGGVPLMLIGVDDITKISSLIRPKVEQVYEQIYSDLDNASIFFENYQDLKGPHKVTRGAVHALYSRVALYRGDWKKVIEQVDKSLLTSQATLSSKDNYLSDWREAVHPESIFELKFNESENLGDLSVRGAYTSRAFYESENFTIQAVIAVNTLFYSLYDDLDIRKGLFRLGVGNNKFYYEIYKFISKNGVQNLDNIPIIRMSELYLNRAEAYYYLGDKEHQNALFDVNIIRRRAGLIDVSLLGTALLTEILHQRRLELAFEGHRWFDLKRNGMGINKETGSLNFDDYRILAPIPNREINIDGVLKQNYGY